jgi:hypothetical protein
LAPVTIDLPLILDPYKMATVISEIDIHYSEIIVPESLRFIEFWGGNSGIRLTNTLELFEDNKFIDSDEIEKFFKLRTDVATQQNFVAGLKLFRMAYNEGIVSRGATEPYWIKGKKALNVHGYYFDSQSYDFPGGSVYINPDQAGYQMEAIIGIATERDAIPILGDTRFIEWICKKEPPACLFGEEGNLVVDPEIEGLLKLPEPLNIADLYFFARNQQKYKMIREKLVDRSGIKRSMMLSTLEFGTTNFIDHASFGGLPVVGSIVQGLKLVKNWLSLK